MDKKIKQAGIRYFTLKEPDAERLGYTGNFDVFETARGIVFVLVLEHWDNYDIGTLRDFFEEEITTWFRFHDERTDVVITCDVIQIRIINKSRALIRHHINALETEVK